MASLGATSAALPNAAFPQAAHLPAPTQKQSSAEPTTQEDGIHKPTLPPFPGLKSESEDERGMLSLGLAADKSDKELGVGLLEAEVDGKIVPNSEEEVDDVDKYDPQAAFEEQAQRITDLVDRFEEFLRKLDEAMAKAAGENDQQTSLKMGFALNREAEEIVGVIESTATAILEAVKSSGELDEADRPNGTSPTPPKLNVVY